MFLDTASAIPLSTPEVPHLLHEDWRPAPPPIREPALPVCGGKGGNTEQSRGAYQHCGGCILYGEREIPSGHPGRGGRVCCRG